MTVCVAAISENHNVIVFSDRMVTTGNVQFSPPRSKIIPISNAIVAAISGDVGLASHLLARVHEDVTQRIAENPASWIPVFDVAMLWRKHYQQMHSTVVETRLLAPLGLTTDSFISRQTDLSSDLVEKLSTEMIHFQLPAMEIIFSGLDSSGPHIFTATGAEIRPNDAIGFAAIGSGAYHAASYMMFAAHTPASNTYSTLSNVYAAKKRAEVAPGVGPETDTRIIWQLGGSAQIIDGVMECLETMYEEVEEKIAEIKSQSDARLTTELNRILLAPAEPSQESATDEEAPDPDA